MQFPNLRLATARTKPSELNQLGPLNTLPFRFKDFEYGHECELTRSDSFHAFSSKRNGGELLDELKQIW